MLAQKKVEKKLMYVLAHIKTVQVAMQINHQQK